MVTRKGQLSVALQHSHKAELAFVASLSQEQRSAVGTYENWCAKDLLAHMSYWQEHQAQRVAALARGEKPPASPSHYEQANAACFERFCHCSWEEVQAYAELAQAQLTEAVRGAPEDVLAAPPADSPGRALWLDVVNVGYTHPLAHMAEYYTQNGQSEQASRLWQEWGELVASLDDNADWQGLVHYNQACGFALAGSPEQAIAELRQALKLRPSLVAWSRRDQDLTSLHGRRAYRELYAPEHWWKAMEANVQAEALADQFMRALSMFRQAVQAFPAEEWRKGDTPYQRPAGLALHLVDAIADYAVLKPGESGAGRPFDVGWEEQDSAGLPSQDDLLLYLDQAEVKLASFLADADLAATEGLFRWTGSTLLSRMAYALRHTQHHLAEMCLELHRRGLQAPQWE